MNIIDILAVVINSDTTNMMSTVLMGLVVFVIVLLGFYLFYPKK